MVKWISIHERIRRLIAGCCEEDAAQESVALNAPCWKQGDDSLLC